MANKKRNKQKSAAAVHNAVVNDATASAHNEPDATQLVPRAVLSRILDHTSQPTVIMISGVCSSWRAVAQSHKYYYAQIILDGDGCRTTKDYHLKSQSFAKSLGDAKRYFERLDVAVFSPLDDLDDDDDEGSDEDEKIGNGSGPDAFAVLAVSINLDSIFRLSLSLPEHCAQFVHAMLSTPAPILEEFRFAFHGDDGPGPYLPLPSDLFRSSAPLLQKVSLDGVELKKPVAAFSKVQTVILDQYSSESLSSIAPNFPGMTHLKLDFLDLDFDERYPPFRSSHPPVKSLGSRLRHFELTLYASSEGIPTQLRSVLVKQAIPVVSVNLETDPDGSSDSEASSDQLPFNPAPFLQHVGKPFRVTMRQEGRYQNNADTVVEVFSCGSHFRRLFRADSRAGLPERMLTGDLLVPHIRDLEVYAGLLHELCNSVDVFPRMKSLTVDFDSSRDLTWQGLATLNSVKCPVLQSICLRSAEPRIVPARDVARILDKLLGSTGFGSTLGLSLAKLQLEPPTDTSEIEAIVKDIRYISA